MARASELLMKPSESTMDNSIFGGGCIRHIYIDDWQLDKDCKIERKNIELVINAVLAAMRIQAVDMLLFQIQIACVHG